MSYFRDMSRISGMEKKAKELYRVKAIRGFLHLCLGQVMLALCWVFDERELGRMGG